MVRRLELNLPRSNITPNRLGYGSPPPFDPSHRLRRVSFPLHQPHRRRHTCLATQTFFCSSPSNKPDKMRFNIQFPNADLRKSVSPLVANFVVVLAALWLVSDASLSMSELIWY